MASFQVRVVNDAHKPLADQRVALEFVGMTRGMGHMMYTDRNGIVRFDGYEEGPINVYVNGRNYGGYYYEHGEHITITR